MVQGNPNSPVSREWEQLSGSDPDVRRRRLTGLGFNPSAPDSVLIRLLEHDHALDFLWHTDLSAAVIQAVLAHPRWRVRAHLLDNLQRLSPRQWAGLLEGPHAEQHRRQVIVELCAESGIDLPDGVAERTTLDPSPRVRAAATALPGVPGPRLVALAADPEPAVRTAAAAHAWAHLDNPGRQSLLDDPAPAVRAAALPCLHQDTPIPITILDELAGQESRIARTCALTPDAFRRLADHTPSLRRHLAHNPRLDAEQVAELAADTDPSIRLSVSVRPELTDAQRGAIPLEINEQTGSHTLLWVAALHHDEAAMRRLAGSPHPFIRRSVARAPRLPADVVAHLARDPDRVVHLFLAESCADASPEVLLSVAAWWSGSLSYGDRPRNHPNFPREGLLRLAEDPNPLLRRLALDDPASDAALAEKFADDPDETVRARATADPRLSGPTLERMLDEPDLRALAARNPNLPEPRLVELLCSPRTARDAAMNPRIPHTVMHRMIDDAEVPEPTTQP